MKINKRVIIISGLISIGLFVLFATLQIFDSKILALDNKWLFITGVPLLIGLILSGINVKISSSGIELNANLSKAIDFRLISKVNSYACPKFIKGKIRELYNLPQHKKDLIKRLQFVIGKRDYYNVNDIQEYINILTGLEYLEIIDENGRFIALILAKNFKSRRTRTGIIEFSEKIELLIESINNGNITTNFQDAITDSINKSDSLLKAYQKFTLTEQGKTKDNQILPVIDPWDKMIGIIERKNLVEQIAKQALKFAK